MLSQSKYDVLFGKGRIEFIFKVKQTLQFFFFFLILACSVDVFVGEASLVNRNKHFALNALEFFSLCSLGLWFPYYTVVFKEHSMTV